MLLIGSRAAREHFPEARAALDWDVVVSDAEFERVSRSLGPDVKPFGENTMVYRHEGQIYEILRASHSEFWCHLLERVPAPSEGELLREYPVLGTCRVASPPLLLILKQRILPYPVVHFRKCLQDYHFLKQRVSGMPQDLVSVAKLAREDAARLCANVTYPKELTLPVSCSAPDCNQELLCRHLSLHDQFRRGESALALVADAWQGFPSIPIEERRDKMIELLVEEALVMAAENIRKRGYCPSPPKLCAWTLRMLITRVLPMNWRYFAVDHYPQIQSRFLADLRILEAASTQGARSVEPFLRDI